MNQVPVLDSTIHKTHECSRTLVTGLGFPNQRPALSALRAVLHTLRDRLPLENAVHLGAQLPRVIWGLYYDGWDPVREPTRIRHQQVFLDLVSGEQ